VGDRVAVSRPDRLAARILGDYAVHQIVPDRAVLARCSEAGMHTGRDRPPGRAR
jgi:hypothetical protein